MATTELRTAPLHMIRHQDGAIIDLKPLQGFWTTEQYLRLSDHTRMLIEFTDGVIEVLALPTDRHQTILEFLFLLFHSYIQPKGGKILFAALRLAIRPNTFREPDLILLRDANDPRRQNRFWLGADLVVEVVSEDDPERDTVDKVADYAEAKIPEYWIINPLDETITILRLVDTTYVADGVYRRGEVAVSALLTDFRVSVNEVFDAR
jgi:Uma2 family endonuclease